MDDIIKFVQSHPVRKFSKDNMLVYQGELPPSIYVVRSGFIKMFDLSSDGNEQLVGLAGKYDFLPSEVLFTQRIASQYFYAAFTPVEVYVVNRTELMRRIRNNNEALYQIVQTVSEKYHGLRRHLTAVQKPKAREKIVHVLYFLAAYFSDDVSDMPQKPHTVSISLTQQDIANMVGITRETAAHELKQLKAEGYISYSKTTLVINNSLEQLIA